MQFDTSIHSFQCPKCGHGMEQHRLDDIFIDRCSNCSGIWFDPGVAEELRDMPGGEALDCGDASRGREWDEIEDINCPHCGKLMEKESDSDQPHIWFEYCPEHGMFMDAGEFKDLKFKTWADWFRRLNKGPR